jgi:hypothetical protein
LYPHPADVTSSWHLQISLGQSDTLIKPMLIPIIAALLTVSLPSAAADEVARQDQLTLFLMAKRKARPPG